MTTKDYNKFTDMTHLSDNSHQNRLPQLHSSQYQMWVFTFMFLAATVAGERLLLTADSRCGRRRNRAESSTSSCTTLSSWPASTTLFDLETRVVLQYQEYTNQLT
jgi:hypothetical protein